MEVEASAAGEFEEEGEGIEGALFEKTPSGALYEVSSDWLTGRPGRSYQIPQLPCARYMAKKVARISRHSCPISSDCCGLLRPARFSKFESHKIREQQNNLSDGGSHPHRHSKLFK